MIWLLVWACTDAPVADGPSMPGGADTAIAPDDPCGARTLEIGGGTTAHRALGDGASITMVHGAQGGWHLDVSGRINNTGAFLGVAPVITRVSDALQIAGEQTETFVTGEPDGDCAYTFAGVRAFLDDHDPSPLTNLDFLCSLDGQLFEVEVTVNDVSSGVALTDRRELVVYADPLDYCELR